MPVAYDPRNHVAKAKFSINLINKDESMAMAIGVTPPSTIIAIG
jgi:hypothetical protein